MGPLVSHEAVERLLTLEGKLIATVSPGANEREVIRRIVAAWNLTRHMGITEMEVTCDA